jgi:hypothetical protein
MHVRGAVAPPSPPRPGLEAAEAELRELRAQLTRLEQIVDRLRRVEVMRQRMLGRRGDTH